MIWIEENHCSVVIQHIGGGLAAPRSQLLILWKCSQLDYM